VPRNRRAALGALIALVVLAAPAAASAAPTVNFGPADGLKAQSAAGIPAYTFSVIDDGSGAVSCDVTYPDATVVSTPVCSSPVPLGPLNLEGEYTVSVTDTDGTGTTTQSQNFWIDLNDPTGSFDVGSPANNTIFSSNPGTVLYQFTVSDPNGAPPLAINCTVSGQLAEGPNTCTNSYSFSTSLSGDGNYTFTVNAGDGSGRTMTPLSRSFTIDTAAPSYSTLPTITPAADEHTTGYTNNPSPMFVWATTDLTSVTYDCWIDSDPTTSCNGATFTALAPLSQGAHVFHVTATDQAGHTNTKTKSFTVDTTAPTFSFAAALTTQHGASPWATFTLPIGFTVTPSETLDGSGASCNDGVSSGACNGSFSEPGPLTDGELTLTASGTDLAGNAGSSPRKFFVDRVAPDAPNITSQPPLFTNDNTPDFAYTTNDQAPSSAGGAYGPLTDKCDIGSGFGNCSTSPTFGPFADGARTFKVKTTDPAGNTGSQSTYSFTIDTVAPTVDTFDVTPHGHTVIDTRSRTPHFTFTGHDANPTLTFQCSIDGAAYDPCTNTATTGAYDTPTPLQEGHHVLHVKATDQATNTSTTDFDFYVDVTNPTPSTNIPDGTDLVMHQVKTVVCNDFPGDNVYVSGIYTCVATIDGSPFTVGGSVPTHSADLGYHTVDVTATDEAGNAKSTNNGGPHAHYVVNAGPYADVVNGFGPVGYWPGSDGPISTTMADASVHHNDGKWTPGVARGRTGPAVDTSVNSGATATELSGTGGAYGYVTGIDAGAHGYTMDIWIKPADTDQQSIYGHGAGAGEIYIDASGKFAFHHPGVTVTASGTTITPGRWYHLMATWSRTSSLNPGTATLRVEGFDGSMSSLGTETQSNSSSQDASGAAALYIGNGELGNNKTFHGLVADAAYFTKALGSHEFIDLSKAMTWTYHPIRANLTDWTPPTIAISSPVDGDGFQTSKAAGAATFSWACHDFDGDGTVTTCSGAYSSNAGGSWTPVSQGAGLPGSAGTYLFRVTADDGQGAVTKTIGFTVGTYSSVIAQDVPVAYWRLNESDTASTMVDSSGNGHSGGYKWDASDPTAIANGGTGISGDGDTTRAFFGKGAYAYVNDLAVSTVGLTEEAWVNVGDPSRDQVFMEHGGAGVLYVRGGLYRFKPNANHTVELTGPAPSNGAFDQVVGTWDGVNATLYVNGVAVDSAMSIDPPPSGVATFYLGRTDSGLGAFHGVLDEAAYYNYALSAHRVLLHYKADPPAAGAAAAPKVAAPTSPGSADSKAHKKTTAKAKAAAKKRALIRSLTKSVAKAKSKLKVLSRHHASKRRIAAQRKVVARLQHRLRLARR
jgi:hypothetical protein